MNPLLRSATKLQFVTLEERATPATFVWDGEAGLADPANPDARVMSNATNWSTNATPPANGTADLVFPALSKAFGEIINDLGDNFLSSTFNANGYMFANPSQTRLDLNLSIAAGIELGLKGLFNDAKLNIMEDARLLQIDPGVISSDFDGVVTLTGIGEFSVASISGNGSVTLDKGSKLNPGKRDAAGTLATGQGFGQLNIVDGTLEIDIVEDNGNLLGDTISDQVIAFGGGVTLQSNARLALSLPNFVDVPVGKQLIIVDNRSGNAVAGQFAGLPEGSIVYDSSEFTGPFFRLSYVGGNGNDIALTCVNAPSFITSDTLNGTYFAGQSVNVKILFYDAITLAGGSLLITLDTGAMLSVGPVSGASSVDATYVVPLGHTSPDLTVTGLSLSNGATLRDVNNKDVLLDLPPSNLDDSKAIVINAVDTPPTITDVSDTSTPRNIAIGPIAFTVGDVQTPAASLTLSASSSNTTLVPMSNIVFSGSGANRAVSVTPATDQTGTAVITLTVTDAGNLTASDTFILNVTVPPPPPPPPPPPESNLTREFSLGSDRGLGLASLHDPNANTRFAFAPFGADFSGGIRTAAGDFTGDGIADLAVASGPGMPGTVRLYDGVTKAPMSFPETVAGGGLPFGSTFTRGIIVAAGDLNNDDKSDLIITAEAGGGARVRIFQSTGNGFVQRSDFIALIGGDNVPDSKIFRGGSRTTVSDINGDGTGDLIWAAGAGGGPRIATFDGARLDGASNVFFKLTGDFFALGTNLRDGAYIAGGDVNGDGIGDLIAGGGSGAPPQVVGYSGVNLMQNKFTRFLDFNIGPDSGQGIRVAVKDLNADAAGDVIVGSAPGAGSRIAAFSGKNLAGSVTGPALFEFDAFAGFSGGVFVG